MPDKTANAKYQAAYKARMNAAGLVARKVWAHPDDWDAIRKLEKKLQRKRQK